MLINEARGKLAGPVTVHFHHCDEFNNTYEKHVLTKGVHENMLKFKEQKAKNPLENYGSKDTDMNKKAPIGQAVPGILHSGLTQDVSVFYTIHGGGDKRHINLYGIYSHEEAGIGTPQNIKKQKSLAKRFKNQSFED